MRDTNHEKIGIRIMRSLMGWLMVFGTGGLLLGSQIWVWENYSATPGLLVLFEGLWCIGSAIFLGIMVTAAEKSLPLGKINLQPLDKQD